MDALTTEVLLFVLEHAQFDRAAVYKIRELRRQLQEPEKKPENLEPLCPH